MAYTPTILAFAGSLRRDSYNKKLVKIAAEGAVAAGANVEVIDLTEYPLPMFDEDVEKLTPRPRRLDDLHAKFHAADGFLIASPEYNSSISAALKNTIDWLSRKTPEVNATGVFQGKVAGLLSTSTGALGGLRALVHLRSILGNIGVIVLPQQVAVMKAGDAFTPEGTLKDDAQKASVLKIGAAVATTSAKLRS